MGLKFIFWDFRSKVCIRERERKKKGRLSLFGSCIQRHLPPEAASSFPHLLSTHSPLARISGQHSLTLLLLE